MSRAKSGATGVAVVLCGARAAIEAALTASAAEIAMTASNRLRNGVGRTACADGPVDASRAAGAHMVHRLHRFTRING